MSFHSFKVIKASWRQHRNEHIKHHAKWSKLLTDHSPKSFFTIRVDNKQHQAMTWTTIIHSYHVEVTPYSFSSRKYKWYPMNNNMAAPKKKMVVKVSVSPFLRRYCQFPCLFLGAVFLRVVSSMFEIYYPWGFWRNSPQVACLMFWSGLGVTKTTLRFVKLGSLTLGRVGLGRPGRPALYGYWVEFL